MSKYQEYVSIALQHLADYFFVITSLVGSLIGLRSEKGLSSRQATLVVFTSVTTTVMIALLVDHYFKPGIVVISILCHFTGLVGNKITLAFIELVDNITENPKKTIRDVIEIAKLLLTLKR